MSCHHIGRGLNNVVRTVVSLMEENKISKKAAKTIIRCCADSVYWCDGNSYEATDYIHRCLCGRCMKRVPAGEKLYSVGLVSDEVPNRYDLYHHLASDGLCGDCFDIVLAEHCKDAAAGERERRYIEEHNDPEDYISTGKYEDHNNGSRWVDDVTEELNEW